MQNEVTNKVVVEGGLHLSDDDLLEIVTFYNDTYDGKGMVWEGKHAIDAAEHVVVVDTKESVVMSKKTADDIQEMLKNYVVLLRNRATWARFWDVIGKFSMILWLVLAILFLVQSA